MSDVLLACNVGSATLKFALYAAEPLHELLRGTLDWRDGVAHLALRGALATRVSGDVADVTPDAAAAWLVATMRRDLPELSLRAAAHRIVHSGTMDPAPRRFDADLMQHLHAWAHLAPGHQDQALRAVRSVAERWPDLPQIACFDTAFHATQPQLARLFALPRAWRERGIVRYGFHGLSYAYVATQLAALVGERARGRIVIAHLGSGSSLCAVRSGASVATTMGFGVLDGLPMGTRCGALDPAVVLHLIEHEGLSAAEVGTLLHRHSGLLGLSGISADVRTLEASPEPAATLALDYYAWRAAQDIAAMAATIEGIDALVFTGGIGAHSPDMRQRIARRCAWLGVQLDAGANAANAPTVSSAASPVTVHTVVTDEELMLARAAQAWRRAPHDALVPTPSPA